MLSNPFRLSPENSGCLSGKVFKVKEAPRHSEMSDDNVEMAFSPGSDKLAGCEEFLGVLV